MAGVGVSKEWVVGQGKKRGVRGGLVKRERSQELQEHGRMGGEGLRHL